MQHRGVIGAVIALLVLAGGSIFLLTQESDESVVDMATDPNLSNTSEQAERDSEGLLSSDYIDDYTLADDQYDTEVMVQVDEAANTRTIIANALPNHETGEFPNEANPNTISEQSRTYTYPLIPVFTGTPLDVGTPGVALNGVKFEPGTAETFTCSSGETYRVEAIQDLTSLGLDFNNAHVQPTGEYHYHGISTMMAAVFDSGNDLVHVGFAADGHLIYYSKSGAYNSSYRLGSGQRSGTGCEYSLGDRVDVDFSNVKDGAVTSDWEYVEGLGELDECNGVTIDGQYVYLMTEEFPYISRCLMGEATETGPGGSGGGAPSGGPNGSQQGPPPGQRPQ